MNIIKKIISFLNNIFHRDNNVKMLGKPVIEEKGTNSFLENLKVSIKERKNKKVETLTCTGDGLGIQNKIEY